MSPTPRQIGMTRAECLAKLRGCAAAGSHAAEAAIEMLTQLERSGGGLPAIGKADPLFVLFDGEAIVLASMHASTSVPDEAVFFRTLFDLVESFDTEVTRLDAAVARRTTLRLHGLPEDA
jgi:hypothetical protein